MQQINQWDRMTTGRPYTPSDIDIVKQHQKGMGRCDRFNKISPRRSKAKQLHISRCGTDHSG